MPVPNSTGARVIENSSIRPLSRYSWIVSAPPAMRTSRSEQADAGAEQHGREGNRELVDQAAVQVLLDRLGAAGDAHVAVAGGLAGLEQRALDAVVDEVEGGAAVPHPGVRRHPHQ